MTTLANLSIKSGDTFTETLTVTDDAGAAIDITGAALTFHLRAQGAVADTLSQALVLTTPLAGLATLTLSAAQTAGLTARTTYRYEVECVDATSAVTTPVQGLCYVGEDFG